MRIFVLARHGQTTLNVKRRVNADPAVPVDLTELGHAESQMLGRQLAGFEFDVCVHTRFARTRQTAEIAFEGRSVPFVEEPLFDDVDIGELEGWPIDEYRAVKTKLGRTQPFPGGESLDGAALRYAAGFTKLLAAPHRAVAAILHEIPVRYAINAAGDSDELDGPFHDVANAAPFLFSADSLARAAERIEQLASSK